MSKPNFYALAPIFILTLCSGCYSPKKIYYGLQLKHLHNRIVEKEKIGKVSFCTKQIQTELVWLFFSNPDFDRVSVRLNDLKRSLEYPEKFPQIDEQSETDGAWGKCFTEWFFKLDASYEEIASLAEKRQTPKIQTAFLDRINSPESLTNHLKSILVSDLENG